MAWYSVPILFVEVVVFAAFAVSVGMFCAAKFRTSKQAISVTLVVLLLGTTLVPWIGCKVLAITLAEERVPAESFYSNSSRYTPWTGQLATALSPPRALAESVVESEFTMHWYYQRESGFRFLVPYLFGSLVLYALAAAGLAKYAAANFRAQVRTRAERSRRAASEVIIAEVEEPAATSA